MNISANPPKPIRVALTNDFELVVAGLAALLAPWREHVEVVDLPLRGRSVSRPVDIAMFDTFGHPNNGMDEITRLRLDPNVKTIAVFTWQFDPSLVNMALRAGVNGYLGKDLNAPELVDSLTRISNGDIVVSNQPSGHVSGSNQRDWPGKAYALSEREGEVLVLIAEGLSNLEIAEQLHISPNSVKTHIRNGYRKIQVSTRAQAVRAVLDRHMVRRPA